MAAMECLVHVTPLEGTLPVLYRVTLSVSDSGKEEAVYCAENRFSVFKAMHERVCRDAPFLTWQPRFPKSRNKTAKLGLWTPELIEVCVASLLLAPPT